MIVDRDGKSESAAFRNLREIAAQFLPGNRKFIQEPVVSIGDRQFSRNQSRSL